MAKPVSLEEIQKSAPRNVSVSTSDIEISGTRLNQSRRKFFSIIPLTAGVIVTITYGEQAAVQNAGFVIGQYQSVTGSDDVNNPCWQGPIHVVASAAGTVSIVEVFE